MLLRMKQFCRKLFKSIPELEADIVLDDYNPQSPVVDSMRTALFNLPGVDESIWSELSIWNRSFSKRIRTGAIELTPDRQKYKYRYIMQKRKICTGCYFVSFYR